MCSAKTVLVVVAAVALLAYGFDCLAMTTPEQAMQCCTSTTCAPNGHHSRDCCKTMPSVQTAFLQSSVGHIVSSAYFGAMIITEFGERPDASTEKENGRVSHPPPIACSQASPPIRI